MISRNKISIPKNIWCGYFFTILLILLSASAFSQSDLYKLKKDFIDCSKYGAIIESANIELRYADSNSFTVPYRVFLLEIGFKTKYKVLIAPNLETKREAIKQVLNIIIDNEVRL